MTGPFAERAGAVTAGCCTVKAGVGIAQYAPAAWESRIDPLVLAVLRFWRRAACTMWRGGPERIHVL